MIKTKESRLREILQIRTKFESELGVKKSMEGYSEFCKDATQWIQDGVSKRARYSLPEANRYIEAWFSDKAPTQVWIRLKDNSNFGENGS